MDAALRILRTLFNGKIDKADKKTTKSPYTSSSIINGKWTSIPATPQAAPERAKIKRLMGRRTAKKAPLSRGADVGDGTREGRGESIQIGTGGIAELVPNSGQNHGSHGGGGTATHHYSSYDGGGGDGGGGGC